MSSAARKARGGQPPPGHAGEQQAVPGARRMLAAPAELAAPEEKARPALQLTAADAAAAAGEAALPGLVTRGDLAPHKCTIHRMVTRESELHQHCA